MSLDVTEVSSGSGGLSGSGTTNTVAKWTGVNALGDSTATDDGSAFSVNKQFVLSGIVQISLPSGIYDDFDIGDYTTIQIEGDPSAAIVIKGIAGGTLGREITFENIAGGTTIEFQYGNSGTPGNQMDTPGGSGIKLLGTYEAVTFQYYGGAWIVKSQAVPLIDKLTSLTSFETLAMTDDSAGNILLTHDGGYLDITGSNITGNSNRLRIFNNTLPLAGGSINNINIFSPFLGFNTTAITLGTEGVYGPIYFQMSNEVGANGATFYNPGLDVIDFAFRTAGTHQTMRFEARHNTPEWASYNSEFQFGPVDDPWVAIGDRGIFSEFGGWSHVPRAFYFIGTWDNGSSTMTDNTFAASTSLSTPFVLFSGGPGDQYLYVFMDDRTSGAGDSFPTQIYFDITTPCNPSLAGTGGDHGSPPKIKIEYLAIDGTYYQIPLSTGNDGTNGFTQSGAINLPEFISTQGTPGDSTTWDFQGLEPNIGLNGWTLRLSHTNSGALTTPPEARLIIPEGIRTSYVNNGYANSERLDIRAQAQDLESALHMDYHGNLSWNHELIAGRTATFWKNFQLGNTLTAIASLDPSALTDNRNLALQDASGTLALLENTLGQFAATTSAELAAVISDETGSDALVFQTAPELFSPSIDKISNLSANGIVVTSGGDGTLGTVTMIFPNVAAYVSLTNQGADISSTNFSGTTDDGLYRVSYYLEDTTSALGAGAVSVTIGWTDTSGTFQTVTSAAVVLTSVGAYTQGAVFIDKVSGSVQYSVSHTGIFSTAKYALNMTCERMA